MPAYEALSNKQNELIRKALDGSVFAAPVTAALPTNLTTGGTSEVQTITVTGVPTGGTFTLTLSGQTTAPIAYNATAATVQTAIAALANVGTGKVTCTGGPLPGTAVTATFSGTLGDVAQMTRTSSLTGGTTPDVTIATTTPGLSIELATLPAGYVDLGWVDKGDGLSWGRDTDVSEVESWGSFDPTRRDVNKDVTSLAFKAQETKLHTLQMYYGVDLSTITPVANTGEVSFAQPTKPNTRYYRIFAIFQDGSGVDTIWVARVLPRAMISEFGDQTWTDGDDPVAYEMTLSGMRDSDAGYSVRHLFGGPGWKALLTDMGFPAAA
ncbi:MAG: phage tail tube protein [Pseudonocardiales bacterium]